MTEWRATLDRRYHDAAIFDLASVVVETAPKTLQAPRSTPLVFRRLRDAGIAIAVYSRGPDCKQVLRSVGLDEFVDSGIDAQNLACSDRAFVEEVAIRLGVRAERSVMIGSDRSAVEAAIEDGFGLIIGLAHHGADDAELLAWGADTVVTDLAEISVRSGGTAMTNIADAVEVYSQLKELVAVRRPAVFLDFDGTLSEIVDHPASATLVDGAAAALCALAAQCPVTVISGRDLADVRGRVNVEGIWYAGSHGFELLEPDRTHHENTAATESVDILSVAAKRLAETLGDVAGLAVEHKRLAVTVHYRNVSADNVGRVIATVRKFGRSAGLRTNLGRKVIELRPNIAWNKGTTLDWLLEHIESRNGGPNAMLPIYIGDDLTDEDAFDAVQFDGVGIVVRHHEDGDRPSAALFSLGSPAAVCGFIRRLADDLEEIAAAPADAWELVYDGYQPDQERLREALCTVGNGYVATRGCAPEAAACAVHYPGTYAAGVYNELSDRISGRTVENESLVNLPNWLSLTFRINNGPWFRIDDAQVLSYRQVFDLRHATLTRTVRFRDSAGHETTLTQQRFASMHQPHVLALLTTISPENWSGTVEFRSLLDGNVRNTLVERYRPLSDTHLVDSAIDDIGPNSVLLRTHTSQSRIAIAIATRSTVWRDEVRAEARYRAVREGGRGGHDIRVIASAGESITLEKVATIATGRDAAISEPTSAARHYLDESGRYADLHRAHARAWARLWEQCAVNLDASTVALRILRLHLLHVLQTISPHTAELDAGVPARGLHGEAYRGHVFWDSLFVSPVLTVRMPNLARSLLLYRYRRLPQARRAAHRAGYPGAMYPWQSGSDGREVSQQLHLNPQSGRWNPDPSARAHHVGLAIAFNAWQHYQVTGDRQYLVDYGAEMMVEIARFGVGLAKFDGARARYTIDGIIGPDEFHSGYPGMRDDGVNNNAYTNVMAVWVILRAMDALDMLPLRDRLDLVGRIGLAAGELDRWEHVTRRMFVPFHDGVISQFEGYENLTELNWQEYRRRYGNIQRLDRILEAEGDSVNNYKASKQADVLMLFYLLSSEELLSLFGRLDYRFAPEQIPKTVDYYLARTSHGSTLSAVVHSWVLARSNRQLAMDYFGKVLESDVADIQGGTTSEGIHLAAMAGSVDLLQRCFTGLEMRDDRLILGPLWPEKLGPMEFTIVYRGQRLHLRISGRSATVTAEAGKGQPIELECRGRMHHLAPGHTIEVG